MTLVDTTQTKTTPCKAPITSYQSPKTKKRRFQRRNSKTAAMLKADSWNLVSMLQQEHHPQHIAITPRPSYEQQEERNPQSPILPCHRYFTLKLLNDSLREAAAPSPCGDDPTTRASPTSPEPRVSSCLDDTTDENSKSKKVLSHEDVASLVASLLRNPRSNLK